jgi:DNA segregation ATPase FtsK/SpoIIIE, S-DNA-T family
MNIPNWVWALLAAGGAFALYEWLQTQCATPGSTMYGGTLCGYLPTSTAAAAIATPTTPATTTSSQAAMLAAYGLPADAVPSNTPISGNSCSVVNPAQSGYNPTQGAPFYSPSLGTYMCGPQSLWASMSANAPAVAAPAVAAPAVAAPVTAAPTQSSIPETWQWGAGPMPRVARPVVMYLGGSIPPISATPAVTSQTGVSGLAANRIPQQFINRGRFA